MIIKSVTAWGRHAAIGCDAKCQLAWGISQRPHEKLSEDPDDIEWLSDDEAVAKAGEAPVNPGTYEGGDAKPTRPENRLNKWCFRECERSGEARPGDGFIELNDWSKRKKNIAR